MYALTFPIYRKYRKFLNSFQKLPVIIKSKHVFLSNPTGFLVTALRVTYSHQKQNFYVCHVSIKIRKNQKKRLKITSHSAFIKRKFISKISFNDATCCMYFLPVLTKCILTVNVVSLLQYYVSYMQWQSCLAPTHAVQYVIIFTAKGFIQYKRIQKNILKIIKINICYTLSKMLIMLIMLIKKQYFI